jgi:hypothetical protein
MLGFILSKEKKTNVGIHGLLTQMPLEFREMVFHHQFQFFC